MILITGIDCSMCESAKAYIKEHNIEIEQIHIDTSTREGRDLQLEYMVMGVPQIIKYDAEGKETERYIGKDVIDYLESK